MALSDEKRLFAAGPGRKGTYLALDAAQLQKAFQSLDRSVGPKIARKVLRAGGRPILAEARRLVPVLSGDLKGSLKIRTTVKKYRAIGYVQATAPHAHLVEFGTKPHSMKRKEKGSFFRKRRQHPGARPKPYLRPAFDSKKEQAVARARDILRQSILAVTRGGKG